MFDQPLDDPPAVFNDQTRRLQVVEIGAGDQGVTNVILDRIGAVEDRCDTALRLGRGAVFQRTLADQPHLAEFGEANGCGLAGKTASNYEHIEITRHVPVPSLEKSPANIALMTQAGTSVSIRLPALRCQGASGCLERRAFDGPMTAWDGVGCDTIRTGGSPRIARW